MARKSKKVEIVDGKLEELKVSIKENVTGGKKNVRSLDELLGTKSTEYSHGSLDEYADKVKNMTLAELQAHAASVGILPVSDQKRLVARLINQYQKTSNKYYNTISFNTVEPKNRAALEKVLRHGAN
jgi:hypothetical protein